jgi:tetratricopeptide (TPR) repeat protein
MRYLTFLLLLISISANAQQAVIKEVARPMTTYPYSDPDPVARPGRVYPYFRFDGFTNKSEIRDWKMVELENDYIRLAVMPEMGGKVWEAYEKSRQYPFVFSTHVVKFRDISLRGAWTTGGLEFNFGDIGHATTASTPVDYFTRTNPDGSVSCFIGATEWASRTTWRVEIRLAPDKAYFTTRSWWYNNTPVEQEFYHWINAGFKAEGNLEFVFPGTHHVGHGGEFDTWPLDSMGRNISFYEQNNFGSYKSYHIFGNPSNFYGGYWHKDNMGFGRYSPYYEKLGKKVWVLGLSQEGTRWENLLGDGDGLNVELQSGRLFNQASRGSELTPFKHVGFAPYSADAWSDSWFPVKQTRGMTSASLRGALNLRAEEGWLKIDWMSLEDQSDTLEIFDTNSSVLKKALVLKPMELFRDSVKWSGNTDILLVKLGHDVLKDGSIQSLNRPLKAPENFDWESEYGLLVRGTDLSRQKSYAEAEDYLRRALDKNPNLVPALTQMAQIIYRQGSYEKARNFAGKALAVDTYDGAANYFWALSSEKTGSNSDALDGYSVATLSPDFRQAAWLRLAYLAIKRRDWKEAEYILGKCLDGYPPNENASVVMAMTERKRGKHDAAINTLNEQIDLDPLNHFARFEKYLNTGEEEDKNEFVHFIRQEFPHETYIEMAIQYYEWNMEQEALRILELAPVNPMVQLWQAWLSDRSGDKSKSDDKLTLAVAASPELVFPFRTEMIELFSWANRQKPDWKWRYYEALIQWQNNQLDAARSLFISCGNEPDFVPFYLAKAELFRDDRSVAGTSLEKAFNMDPLSWRAGLKLTQYYSVEKQPGKALETAGKNFKAHPSSFIVGLQYAQMLKINKKYAEALSILGGLEMLPAEGDVNAHSLFRETNILYAIEQMNTGKWKKAVIYLNQAETWPENLFSGEPYLPDKRITQFLRAYCFDKLKIRPESEKAFTYIMDYKNPDGWTSSSGNRLAELTSDGMRDYKKITETLLNEKIRDRDSEVLSSFMIVLAK